MCTTTLLVVRCYGSPLVQAEHIGTGLPELARDQLPVPAREVSSERAQPTERNPVLQVTGRPTLVKCFDRTGEPMNDFSELTISVSL
jgi:hypothetical protein